MLDSSGCRALCSVSKMDLHKVVNSKNHMSEILTSFLIFDHILRKRVFVLCQVIAHFFRKAGRMNGNRRELANTLHIGVTKNEPAFIISL